MSAAAIQAAIDGIVNKGSQARLPSMAAIEKQVYLQRAFGVTIAGRGQTYDLRRLPQPKGDSTMLYYSGKDGGDMIGLRGCYGLTLENMALCGRQRLDSTERAGALIHCLPDPAYGPSLWTFRNLTFIDAKAGIIFGETEDDGNCADMMFERLVFNECDSGIKVVNNQGMNYHFWGLFGVGRGCVLDFQRGGHFSVNGSYFVNTAPNEGDWTFNLGPAGPNNQIGTINNIGIENNFAAKIGPFRRVSINGLFCNIGTNRFELDVMSSSVEISNSDIPLLEPLQFTLSQDTGGSQAIITFRNCSFNQYKKTPPTSDNEYSIGDWIQWFKAYCNFLGMSRVRVRDCMIGWGTPIPDFDVSQAA